MTLLETSEIILRVLVAVVSGAAIGLERQWRSRVAGIRTNALVSGGSALFVVVGSVGIGSAATADPTRVAAQIVSGIGFLGAGVILRDGLNIRGINTAATLWCSAAVGALAGAGQYAIAAIGAVLVVVANVVLRPLARFVIRHSATRDVETEEPGVQYVLEMRAGSDHEQYVRTAFLQATSRPGLSVQSLRISPKKHGTFALVADLLVDPKLAEPGTIERTLQHLGLDHRVLSVRWWDAQASD